jgi:hypothetical protein
MLTLRRSTTVATVAAITALTIPVTSPAGTQAARGQATLDSAQYQIITHGLLGSPVFPVRFRSADLRLEIRNLIMGPGAAQAVATPNRTIMELRGGALVTTINGEKRERRPGDFWLVEPGSTLALENQGDVAVIRAIYVFAGRR